MNKRCIVTVSQVNDRFNPTIIEMSDVESIAIMEIEFDPFPLDRARRDEKLIEKLIEGIALGLDSAYGGQHYIAIVRTDHLSDTMKFIVDIGLKPEWKVKR